MKNSELIKKARALIANQAHWMKGEYRSNRPNVGMCYCAVGALAKAAETNVCNIEDNYKLLELFSMSHAGELVRFNDESARKHAELLELFDAAIVKAEQQELAQ